MTAEPRLAYLTSAADGNRYELEIRHSGTAVRYALGNHGVRYDVWVGDIWTDDQEDVLLLELFGWLDQLAVTGERVGRGKCVGVLRLYAAPVREIEICSVLSDEAPLVVQICERLALLARMAHEKRFTQRRVNPLRASRSGEID